MGSSERHQRAGSNNQRIIQDAKRALRLLEIQSKRPKEATLSASFKLAQRSYKRVIAEAVQRQYAQKREESQAAACCQKMAIRSQQRHWNGCAHQAKLLYLN